MKISIFILFTATLIAISCNTKDNKAISFSEDQISAFEKIDSILSPFEPASQTFKVSSKHETTIKGTAGTIIYIVPEDLETSNGSAVGDTIDIKLMELTTTSDLFKARAQTVSNNKILESGGAYFIAIASNGVDLKLKQGRTLSVAFPQISTKDMTLFYGTKNAMGILNWLPTDQPFTIEPRLPADTEQAPADTETEGTHYHHSKKYAALYQTIKLTNLGWINCDRFIDAPNTTELAYEIDSKIKAARIFIVFVDINSVLEAFYWYQDTYNSIDHLPIGSKIKLVAVSLQDNQTYSFQKTLTIQKGENINIEMRPIESGKLKELFQ